MSNKTLTAAGRATAVTPRRTADAAPPWDYNPSSWRQRLPIAALGAVTALIALYMAAYQWRWIPTAWDPVFGDQTARVLDSGVSHTMQYWILVPDAALGAIGYLSEAILGLAGSTMRWRRRPWLVILFGIDVIPLGIVSAVLVAMQGLVVGSWCFLCLVTAVVSLALVVLAYDEVWSSLVYLRDVHRRTHSRRAVWNAFWNQTDSPESQPRRRSVVDFWPRIAELALGATLIIVSLLIAGPNDLTWATSGAVAGALVCACAALSFHSAFNKVHLVELLVAVGLTGLLLIASPRPAPAVVQFQLLVILIVANFAIVPNGAAAREERVAA